MAANSLPHPDVLRQILFYHPESGKLFWRKRDIAFFKDGARPAIVACKRWNTRYADKEAFTSTDRDGYRQGAIFNRRRLAHRVIWALVTGKWPDGPLDHINGNPSDNRISNLRRVSVAENNKNIKRPCNNTTGVAGVYKCPDSGNWFSRVQCGGKVINLGRYKNFDEAVQARQNGLAKYGFHPNHGR